jgi:hypothetical protein
MTCTSQIKYNFYMANLIECHGKQKKRVTIWTKTYVLVLFYRNTWVNHVQSISDYLFYYINLRAAQTCELARMARTWMEILAKIILRSFLVSWHAVRFPHCILYNYQPCKSVIWQIVSHRKIMSPEGDINFREETILTRLIIVLLHRISYTVP